MYSSRMSELGTVKPYVERHNLEGFDYVHLMSERTAMTLDLYMSGEDAPFFLLKWPTDIDQHTAASLLDVETSMFDDDDRKVIVIERFSSTIGFDQPINKLYEAEDPALLRLNVSDHTAVLWESPSVLDQSEEQPPTLCVISHLPSMMTSDWMQNLILGTTSEELQDHLAITLGAFREEMDAVLASGN